MLLSKKNITILSISALAIFFMEYQFLDSKAHALPSKTLLELDTKLFDIFHKKHDTTKGTDIYWGYERSIYIAEQTKAEDQAQVTKKDGQNVLCISSSCYRLLGIHQEKYSSSVTLYNKDLKEKVKAYTKSNTLQDGIFIETITQHGVVFKDTNSTREWNFEIFDVNETKYKPKEKQQ